MIAGNTPEDIPKHFLVYCRNAGLPEVKLGDEPFVVTGSRKGVVRQEADHGSGVMAETERGSGSRFEPKLVGAFIVDASRQMV